MLGHSAEFGLNGSARLPLATRGQLASFPVSSGEGQEDPWVRKIPWRRKWQPTPIHLPGKSHGQRSLVDYSPWDHKELDTTEGHHFHFQGRVGKSGLRAASLPSHTYQGSVSLGSAWGHCQESGHWEERLPQLNV